MTEEETEKKHPTKRDSIRSEVHKDLTSLGRRRKEGTGRALVDPSFLDVVPKCRATLSWVLKIYKK